VRYIFFILLTLAAPSFAAAEKSYNTIDISSARAGMVGNWEGKLEYLDYTANKWFGIPVTTSIEVQGDGATIIRRSQFDDGPPVGIVRITTIELYNSNNAKLTTGGFRKGREPDLATYKVRFEGVPKDGSHWTMIEETDAKDNNRPARIRLTTVRDGAKMQTLKQIDFLDDAKAEWLDRNRTTLTLVK
jgi:hypothetical protein